MKKIVQLKKKPVRKIIHVDMDAFYASVEQLDNPSLRNKEVVVGGTSARGVVCAASYEARKFGVRSAMAIKIAKEKCPKASFIQPRMERYKEISRQIRKIFLDYTPLVEPLSLDEAYLDVTKNRKSIPYATTIAKEIKERIRSEIGLTASAGVGPNKFIAKLASEYDKPDGLVIVPPEKVSRFIAPLDVQRIPGVGPATQKKLAGMKIQKIKDLLDFPMENLVDRLGKAGSFFYQIARGDDDRPVNPDREVKSIGEETTFERDLLQKEQIIPILEQLALQVEKRLAKLDLKGKTVTLKVKYGDFKVHTRSRTMGEYIRNHADIISTVHLLIPKTEMGKRPVRLVGITVSNFYRPSRPEQLTLF